MATLYKEVGEIKDSKFEIRVRNLGITELSAISRIETMSNFEITKEAISKNAESTKLIEEF